MTTVGVRELRQNLSQYLDRVKEGTSLEVTEHGRVVARLTPAGEHVPPQYARLAAKYGATIPTGSFRDLLDELPRRHSPAGTTDALLAEGRAPRV
jgi:prevent-host-death family protein